MRYLYVCLFLQMPLPALCQYPSFTEAMRSGKTYDLLFADKDKDWRLLHHLYNKNVLEGARGAPRIPKVIHQIWVGSPIPAKYEAFRRTWLEQHHDWEYLLWTDKEVEALGLKNQAAYDRATNYGEKSDIARYEILYRFGGLYIDTDFECIKSLDVFHEMLDFYVGIGYAKKVHLYNGLIASVPGHPILKKCIDLLKAKPNPKAKDNALEIINRTGPGHITRCFLAVVTDRSERVAALPSSFFYPWPNYALKEKDPYKYLVNESVAVHHWHISWAKMILET